MAGIAEKLRQVIGEQAVNAWAEQHDLPPQTVHDWIKFDRRPTGASMKALVAATDIPADWWLHGEGPPPNLEASLPQPGDRVVIRAGKRIEKIAERTKLAPGRDTPVLSDVGQRMYMAMSPDADHGPEEVDWGLIRQCLYACEEVHGAPFVDRDVVVQMEYAVDLYNLLVRISRQRPGGGPSSLDPFKRLEVKALAEQLRIFLQMGWAKRYPPPQTESFSW